jgi:secreted trypsin-like serine protease
LQKYSPGWGRGAGVQPDYLRQVDLPLVNVSTCQDQLRKTVLGPKFILDQQSFICAGGEAGKDACAGDGGSPLMCKVGANWYVVGKFPLQYMTKFKLMSS